MKIGVCYRGKIGGFISAEDYDEAINDLTRAKEQLKPNGNCCAVCEDGGHQAWECHHNPLVMARRTAKELATYRCFHCGKSFTDLNDAKEHFGSRDERERPACEG